MKCWIRLILISAAFFAVSDAAVILSDTFDRGAVGANDNALGGTITQNYISGGDATRSVGISSNELALSVSAGTAWAMIDYDFNTNTDIVNAGGFTVQFDMDSLPVGGGSYAGDPWVAFALGLPQLATSTSFAVVNAGTSMGSVYKPTQDGSLATRVNGVVQSPFATVATTGTYTFLYTVTSNDFSQDGSATVSLKVNGLDVALGDAGALSNEFTWESDNNYLYLESRVGGTFDNLIVSTIPEPQSFTLIALAGSALILMGAFRSRK